jgi:hypothetical protein
MTARAAGGLAVLAVMIGGAGAGAAPTAGGGLVIRAPTAACAAAPAFVSFVASLRVELAASAAGCCAVSTPDAPAPPGRALAVEPCDPAADEVEVVVSDPAGGEQRRRISLADVAPDARPRALALAVAELVRSLPASGPAAPAPPPASTPALPAARPRVLAASLDAELRGYPSLATRLWGGRLGVGVAGARWFVEGDLGAATGDRQFDAGGVRVRLLHADAVVGPRLAVGGVVLDAAAVGELGWAWVDGEAPSTGVVAGGGSGLVGAVGARAGVEVPVPGAIRARATIEGGGTVRSLTGDVDGAPSAGISGAYLMVTLGIRVLR